VLRGYGAALAVDAVSTLLAVVGEPVLHATSFVMLLTLGALVIASRFGIGAALLTAVGGAISFDFVFVPPAMAFALPNLRDGFTLFVIVAVAAAASVVVEKLRRQARRARRAAEFEGRRNAILSALSHDLRTPLSALVGAGTALEEDVLEPGERRAFSRVVAEEARRLNRLVQNLLELTRLESSGTGRKVQLQAIDEVIASALSRLKRPLEGRTVRTDVPEETPLAPFDPLLIEQVVLNLLENVLRHTPAGTPIEVTGRATADELFVEIADRGPGVPSGDEERVFEKLYRGVADRRGDAGTGLGLTICRAIMTAHDGRIWLENRPGGGALVRAALPLRRNPSVDLRRSLRDQEDT
jgi:two-component system sensor histidine kinase KdpD